MYAARRRQASQGSTEKEGMHPSFLASQIDASKAKESFISGCILSSEALQKGNGCIWIGAKLQTKLTG
jgi:hypothetical protein